MQRLRTSALRPLLRHSSYSTHPHAAPSHSRCAVSFLSRYLRTPPVFLFFLGACTVSPYSFSPCFTGHTRQSTLCHAAPCIAPPRATASLQYSVPSSCPARTSLSLSLPYPDEAAPSYVDMIDQTVRKRCCLSMIFLQIWRAQEPPPSLAHASLPRADPRPPRHHV